MINQESMPPVGHGYALVAMSVGKLPNYATYAASWWQQNKTHSWVHYCTNSSTLFGFGAKGDQREAFAMSVCPCR